MVLRLVLWSLADADAISTSSGRYLRETAVDEFGRLPGLLFKPLDLRRGIRALGLRAVWSSHEAAEQALPSGARELIGKDPDVVEVFDLEATASVAEELARLGLSFR